MILRLVLHQITKLSQNISSLTQSELDEIFVQSTIQQDQKNTILTETKLRSLIKSITWRLIASLTTIIITYIFTNNISIALSLGIVDVFSKFILYYIHERCWSNTKWGMK